MSLSCFVVCSTRTYRPPTKLILVPALPDCSTVSKASTLSKLILMPCPEASSVHSTNFVIETPEINGYPNYRTLWHNHDYAKQAVAVVREAPDSELCLISVKADSGRTPQ